MIKASFYFGLACVTSWVLVGCTATSGDISRRVSTSSQAPTVFIASDSTAANHKARSWPMAGWGVFLQCAFPPRIQVENHAIGARSTRTFIEEGRLDRIKNRLKPGDILLIQFAHNDANQDKPERYVTVETFSELLNAYVDVAHEAEARPILITAVARRHFEAGQIVDDFAPYIDATRTVAAARDADIIDLRSKTKRWLEALGETESKSMFLHLQGKNKFAAYPDGLEDDTHFSELGARRVAGFVAEALHAMNLPISSDIIHDQPAFQRTKPLGALSCH
jgi:lysophospholipase L1-like esterase